MKREVWIDLWLKGVRELSRQANKHLDETWPPEFRKLVVAMDAALTTYDKETREFKASLKAVLDGLHAQAMASKAEREGTRHVGTMLPIVDGLRDWSQPDEDEERRRRARADTSDGFAAVVAEVLVESLTSGETSSLSTAETNSDSGADTSPAYDDSPSYDAPSYDGGGGGYGGGGASGSWSDD